MSNHSKEKKIDGIGEPQLLPDTPIAWIITIVAIALTGFSIWVELPMWLVVLDLKSVSDWSGEYALALFIGVPCTIVSLVILGFLLTKHEWRSQLARHLFVFVLILLFAALAIIIVKEIVKV